MKFFDDIWKTSHWQTEFRHGKFDMNHPKSFRKCSLTYKILQNFPALQLEKTENLIDIGEEDCPTNSWGENMTIKVEIFKCKLKVDGFESDFSFFKKLKKMHIRSPDKLPDQYWAFYRPLIMLKGLFQAQNLIQNRKKNRQSMNSMKIRLQCADWVDCLEFFFQNDIKLNESSKFLFLLLKKGL